MSSDRQPLAPTGIEPIDAALGGLEPGRAHVVYGELETGKTTLATHFLVEGLRRGETCVFVVRYDPAEVVRAMRAVGYDCGEDLRAERLVIFEYSWDLVGQLAQVDDIGVILDELKWLLEGVSPHRIAFDSADFVFAIQHGYGYPLQITSFLGWLGETGATSLLLVEERVSERIVQSFRANAKTVIHTLRHKTPEGYEYSFAFEKGPVKAPQRKVCVTPEGYTTIEIVDAHGKTLPLPASPARPAPAGDRTGQLSTPDEAARLIAEAVASTVKPPPAPPPPPQVAPVPRRTGRPRVLVIDEDVAARRVAERALSPECDVVVEPDGISGVPKLTSFDPDLVIVDTKLPLVDGFAVCRQIRQNSPVPILVVSGTHTAPKDRAATAEAGADLFLEKPFGVRELVVRSRQLIARYRGVAPPAGAAATENVPVDALVDFEQFQARLAVQALIPPVNPALPSHVLLGCALGGVDGAATGRVADVVRWELGAQDVMALTPASGAAPTDAGGHLVALVERGALSPEEMAAQFAKQVAEHAGVTVEFWSAPVANADAERLLAERVGLAHTARQSEQAAILADILKTIQ